MSRGFSWGHFFFLLTFPPGQTCEGPHPLAQDNLKSTSPLVLSGPSKDMRSTSLPKRKQVVNVTSWTLLGIQYSLLIHGFSYTQSTDGKYSMGKSKNKHFVSFKLHAVLSSMMKSHSVLPTM